jgi:hypothetical protein
MRGEVGHTQKHQELNKDNADSSDGSSTTQNPPRPLLGLHTPCEGLVTVVNPSSSFFTSSLTSGGAGEVDLTGVLAPLPLLQPQPQPSSPSP